MKKFYLFTAAVGVSTGLAAQITITQSELNRPPSYADTIFMDNTIQMPVPPRGGNATYDFSSAFPTTVAVEYDQAAGANPDFPGAHSFTSSTLRIQQFQVNADFYTALDASGYYPYGRQLYDTAFPLQAVTGNPSDTMYFPDDVELYNGHSKFIEFPVTYSDSNSYKSVESTNFMLSVQGFGLNKTPGTIKRINEDKRAVVGWGNIIVPGKSGNASDPIPVLMIKRYGKVSDSVYLGGSPAPAPLVAAFGTSQGATIYDTSYVFYTENFTGWVAVAFVKGGEIDEIRWRPAAASGNVSVGESRTPLVSTYPNPVSPGALLSIRAGQVVDKVQILGMDGRVIFEATMGSGSEQRLMLPENIPPGTYLLQVFSNSAMPAGITKLMIR